MHYVRLRVRGRVQGVGFRYFVLTAARSLGVHGVARNLPGGDVEIEAGGHRDALEALVERARQGPPHARVDDVEAEWSEEHPRFGNTFRIE